jgi:hypothetical protein
LDYLSCTLSGVFFGVFYFFLVTHQKRHQTKYMKGAKCSKKTGIFEGRTATKKIKNPEELFLTHEEGKSFAFFHFPVFSGVYFKIYNTHTHRHIFSRGILNPPRKTLHFLLIHLSFCFLRHKGTNICQSTLLLVNW